jgi:hypothetical protein
MYIVRAEALFNHGPRDHSQRVARLCRRLRGNDETLQELQIVDFTPRNVAKVLRDLPRATKLRLYDLVLARSEVTLESFLSLMTLLVQRKPDQQASISVPTSPLKQMFLCLHDDDIPIEEIRYSLFDGIATDNPPGICELEQLQLCCGILSVPSAAAIGRALAGERTALTHLNLENNGLTDETVALISNGLNSNHTLRHIALSNNSIGDAGAQHLAHSLTLNSTLKSLDLKDNSVGNAGAIALAFALDHQNRSLYSLVLEGNDIEEAGLAALCRAIVDNPAFEYLSIDNNIIGDEGERILVDAVANMRYLQRLKFGPLQRTSNLVRLAASMEHNVSIFQVGFECNIDTFAKEENLEELGKLTAHVNIDQLEYFESKVEHEHPGVDVPVEKIRMLAKYKPYIDMFCLLNKIGIRSLIFNRDDRVPLGLWSFAFDGLDETFVYYILREKPDLLLHAADAVRHPTLSLFQVNPNAVEILL